MSTRPDQLAQLADALQPAVLAAGAAIMAVHASGVQADLKEDGSPVTQADRAAEDLLLPALAELADDIPVISEENKASHQLAAGQRFFLVDPLDGTREFIKRLRKKLDPQNTINPIETLRGRGYRLRKLATG